MNNTIKHLNNGDFEVIQQPRKVVPVIQHSKFLLLNPLLPSYFGYADSEVTRMVNELKLLGIGTLMVSTNSEICLYAHSTKDNLEKLCTVYDINGMLVEYTALYDQVEQLEMV
jgi:hypothetical protein